MSFTAGSRMEALRASHSLSMIGRAVAAGASNPIHDAAS